MCLSGRRGEKYQRKKLQDSCSTKVPEREKPAFKGNGRAWLNSIERSSGKWAREIHDLSSFHLGMALAKVISATWSGKEDKLNAG